MNTEKKELSVFERGEIIGAWKCKKKEREIADILDHPKSTVHDVIYAYRNLGFETMPPQNGRPQTIIERDGRYLEKLLKENRRTNIYELTDNFVASTSTNVNTRTVKHYLHDQGFYERVGVKKPLVTEPNRKKRLLWAQEHENWEKEWKNVIWSDESKFELFKGDGRKYVWRQEHEKYDLQCLIPTFKSGQESVMIWGCFTESGLGLLVKLEGRITAVIYVDILQNNLLSYIDTLENKEDYIFQEDNAPIYTVNIAKKWRRDNNITNLSWPAQSPDMNPIENLWEELDKQVQTHKLLPKNQKELWQALQEEWINLNENKYKNLVDSMPCRIATVIASKGNPTKY